MRRLLSVLAISGFALALSACNGGSCGCNQPNQCNQPNKCNEPNKCNTSCKPAPKPCGCPKPCACK